MAAPNSQNNFIFNNTAPINFNFYKDKDEGKSQEQKTEGAPGAAHK